MSSLENLLDPGSVSQSHSSVASSSQPVSLTPGDLGTASPSIGGGASKEELRTTLIKSHSQSSFVRDHHHLLFVSPPKDPGALPPSANIFSPTAPEFEEVVLVADHSAPDPQRDPGAIDPEPRVHRTKSLGKYSSVGASGSFRARPPRASTALGIYSTTGVGTNDSDDEDDEDFLRAREEAIRRRKAAEKLEGFFGTTYDELIKPSTMSGVYSPSSGSSSPPQIPRENSERWSSPLNHLLKSASSFVLQSSNIGSAALPLPGSSCCNVDESMSVQIQDEPLNSNDLDAEARRVLARKTRKIASILGVTPPAELIVHPSDPAEIRHRKSISGLSYLIDRAGNDDDDVAMVLRQAANMGAIPSDTLDSALGKDEGTLENGSSDQTASQMSPGMSPERTLRQRRIRKLQSFFGYQALKAILSDIENQINAEVQTPDARGSLIADLRKLQDKIEHRFSESSNDDGHASPKMSAGRERASSIRERIKAMGETTAIS